ncbi:Aldo-keto reductase [Pyrenophora teres f. maculata]|nr:Aldo-keto reductase [Pyrenophora teres f. maculata]
MLTGHSAQKGLSRTAIFHAVEASLERLQTSYIDVLHIHRYDDTVAPEETMLALHDLVRSGRVRYIGASSMWTYQFATLQFTAERNGWTKFVSMQNHYNLLYREEEREMIRFCRENGVGLIPWSPFAAGRLVRSPTLCQPSIRSSLSTTGDIYDIEGSDCDTVIARVHEIAAQPPIIGFSSIDRMDEALSARGLRLSQEEEDYLEEAYQAKAVIGHE